MEMKHAILATVIDVKRECADAVVVLLESDELKKGRKVVSTGLNCEQSRKSVESVLKVTCKGNPRAEPGDKVPVVVKCDDDC